VRDAGDDLTTSQAAKRVGVSPSTIARWATRGRIQFRLGLRGERLFKPEDIDAVVIKIEQDPVDPEP
jgi:excisionase family DNA binding protein